MSSGFQALRTWRIQSLVNGMVRRQATAVLSAGVRPAANAGILHSTAGPLQGQVNDSTHDSTHLTSLKILGDRPKDRGTVE